MKGMIRVVLVDPADASRQALERLLGEVRTVWVAESCPTYSAAPRALAEHAADLTIVVLDHDVEAGLALVQAILRANPAAVILPASSRRDGELILRAVRAGAREFLTLPAAVDELLGALERLVIAPAEAGSESARRASRVIAVAGAAGGVGCTTIAVNLAALLARDASRSVALADFDLLLGSIDACLDIIPERTILDVAQNVDRLDLTLLKRSLTRHPSGLYVLPRPVLLEDAARVEPEALPRVVAMMKAAFNSVVIDTSKGLQAADMVAFEQADLVLLVIQLDLPCLRNTSRFLDLLRQYEGMGDRVRLLVNRAGSKHSDIGRKKAEEILNLPVSFEIPNATVEFAAARSRGVPLEAEAPNGRAHRALVEMVNEIEPESAASEKPKPRFGRFAAMFA